MEASDLEQYGAEKSTVKSNPGAVYDKKIDCNNLQMKGTDVSVKLQNSKLGKIRIRAYASIKSNQVTTECAAVLQNRPPSNYAADTVKSLLRYKATALHLLLHVTQ